MNTRKIIIKLNRDTKEDKIKWTVNREKPSSLSGSEILSDNVYVCKVLDKNFRLFRYQSKYYHDEDAYEWTDSYRLEFFDTWGNAEWAFPDDRAIYDLYETVRFKTSNIEGFMDKFLTEEDKKDSDPFDF